MERIDAAPLGLLQNTRANPWGGHRREERWSPRLNYTAASAARDLKDCT